MNTPFPEHTEEDIRLRLHRASLAEQEQILADHFPAQTELHDPFPHSVFNQPLRLAAVLVPLLQINEHWHLLFIRRSETEKDAHSGQVAFPGGGCETGESAEQAALREASEEIGLRSADVRVLGLLHPLRTITNFLITPVVGVIPYPFQPDPAEVSRLFTLPLAWLADSKNRQDRQHYLSPQVGSILVIYYSPYNGEVLWGASARITQDFLNAYTLP